MQLIPNRHENYKITWAQRLVLSQLLDIFYFGIMTFDNFSKQITYDQ